MKKTLFIIGLAVLTIGASAQSKNHRLGLTVGGGSQKYSGDLGNGFTFKNDTWYGVVTFNASYYLTKSFDAGIFGSVGDYGFCQPVGKAAEVRIDDRCPGCIGRTTLGNLNSRLTTAGLFIKYKIANGYLLNANAKLQPFVYFGAAANKVSDIMKMNCVNPGNYYSLNAGAGAKYCLTDRINVGYTLSFGSFTSDHVDFKMYKRNDMYMQNTLTVGIDLF